MNKTIRTTIAGAMLAATALGTAACTSQADKANRNLVGTDK